MDIFRDYFVRAGIWAWPALLFSVYILVAGVVLLFTTKKRKTFIIYLIFSFLPIIFGVFGTISEFSAVELEISANPKVTQEAINFYKNEVWIPLLFSVYASIPLFVIALLGIYKSKKV